MDLQRDPQTAIDSNPQVIAARTGSSAEITWNNARSKNSLGMMSKAEYLQAEAEYLQQKSNYERADLELLQAVEDYYWGSWNWNRQAVCIKTAEYGGGKC